MAGRHANATNPKNQPYMPGDELFFAILAVAVVIFVLHAY